MKNGVGEGEKRKQRERERKSGGKRWREIDR